MDKLEKHEHELAMIAQMAGLVPMALSPITVGTYCRKWVFDAMCDNAHDDRDSAFRNDEGMVDSTLIWAEIGEWFDGLWETYAECIIEDAKEWVAEGRYFYYLLELVSAEVINRTTAHACAAAAAVERLS
jgi:hypothetical protein